MLTDKHCKNAACPPDKKRARFTDSGGLYLEVSPAGMKRGFCKLYANGKEGRMALGSYPAVGLTDARKARDAVKLQKLQGADPVQARKVEKLKASRTNGDTFKTVALEWYAKQSPQWSAGHAERSLRQLARDLFPWIEPPRISWRPVGLSQADIAARLLGNQPGQGVIVQVQVADASNATLLGRYLAGSGSVQKKLRNLNASGQTEERPRQPVRQSCFQGVRHHQFDKPARQLLSVSACSETLFGSLRVERLHGQRFVSRRHAKEETIAWLLWYNKAQLHSTLAYVSPVQFEQTWVAAQPRQVCS